MCRVLAVRELAEEVRALVPPRLEAVDDALFAVVDCSHALGFAECVSVGGGV